MKTIAYSSLCCKYIDDILNTAFLNPYKAIEWDLNFIPPTLSRKRIQSVLSLINLHHLNIRYHLPYSYVELAHSDKDIRKYSVIVIKKYLDFIGQLNGKYAVLHIGYNDGSTVEFAKESLNLVVQHAKKLGIILCVENLISGLTTDEKFLHDILTIDGVKFCLDTGHAEYIVRNKNPMYLNTIKMQLNDIVHAHVYYCENNCMNHLPFSESNIRENKWLNLLSQTSCDWCTMELDNVTDQINQMNLLKNFLMIEL